MTTTEQPRTTLADVRALMVARQRAEVAEIVGVVAWIEQHQVDPRTSDDAALRDYGDGELLLGGDGVPAVSEAATVELLTTLERSDSSGRVWLGKALELKYRLPRLWQRVVDGEVEVWRAMRIADSTIPLPFEGAAFVDTAVADFVHSMSWAQLGRTVEAARALHDPEEYERRRTRDPRRFDVRVDEVGIDGYVQVDGLLDLADARDVEAAVAKRAAELAETCDQPLHVRRAMALGEICRGELNLDTSETDETGRGVTLYVHVDDSKVAVTDDGHPVLLDLVMDWCIGASVTIKPVIDLNEIVTSDAYTPSPAVAERVKLTWRQCVFPFCHRRVHLDLDHRKPWPHGRTSTANLAPLCRMHHRMKTFAGWRHDPADTTHGGVPTAFTWISPTGARLRVDRHGTTPLPPGT